MSGQAVSPEKFSIRLRSRGQITLPQAVRARFDVEEGEFLTLVDLGDFLVIAPKVPEVPRLADKIVDLMEEADVSLADLLQGLAEERTAIHNERSIK